jgi:AcrR family transcriptional regulator
MCASHHRETASNRSFIETARRAQIVAAAIDTIAELGYARASFAQIARRARLSSTGLISYHFGGKDELIAAAVEDVVGAMGRFMGDRMRTASAPREALRVYIEGNVEFIASHRSEMKALLDIFMNGGFHYDTDSEQAVLSPVEEILRAGQAAGEFRGFDTQVMSTLIQRAIDGLPFLLAAEPDLDLTAYASEVFTAFDLATRSGGR